MARYVDITMPAEQEEGTESTVGRWLKDAGEAVAEHEPLLEINTDKVVVEIPSPASGVLEETLLQAGDEVAPGQRLGRIRLNGESAPEAAEAAPGEIAVAGDHSSASPRLSPAVRRLLRENDLDPAAIDIEGTGRGGRVTYDDVAAYLQSRKAVQAPAGKPDGASRLVPHTPMRKAIARHMASSMRDAPHVTSVFEADFSAVSVDLAERRQSFQRQGVKLTYTAYLVAAAARALTQVPEVNSRWHDDELEIFEDCNIGVAVGLGKQGLVVPVIHQAQRLSLLEIASRLQQLTQQARDGKLGSSQLEGGTFTITNHGASGSLIATPIIHQPQSAIFGVGKVEKRLQVAEQPGGDAIQIRPMAYVTLTIDHRALDGLTANLFLSHFVAALRGFHL